MIKACKYITDAMITEKNYSLSVITYSHYKADLLIIAHMLVNVGLIYWHTIIVEWSGVTINIIIGWYILDLIYSNASLVSFKDAVTAWTEWKDGFKYKDFVFGYIMRLAAQCGSVVLIIAPNSRLILHVF